MLADLRGGQIRKLIFRRYAAELNRVACNLDLANTCLLNLNQHIARCKLRVEENLSIVLIGAEGRSAFSRISSHSAVVFSKIFAWISSSNCSTFSVRSALVAKRGSSINASKPMMPHRRLKRLLFPQAMMIWLSLVLKAWKG